ncbi:MAG: hypothetical protein J6P98_08540 [Clostridia bacterium]|nr:hypothetical protein [Clostridia bacterium]
MKKPGLIAIVLAAFICTALFASCTAPRSECPLSVFWEGKVWYLFLDGKLPSETVKEDMVLGRVTSVTDLTELPDEDGEANFPAAMGAPIAEYNGFLYLRYVDGVWYRLRPRDSMR